MGTAVSNPASFSSVRSACSAEGYGTSTNFTGYNRGGGIVPNHANTAGVSATDAGLQLSQFSGVTIPSSIVNHTVNITADPTTGSCSSTGTSCNATTASATANVTNGSGSFTYSWSHVSGDNMTINSPSAASTTFTNSEATGTVEGPPATYTGIFRCTVTDTGNGNYAASDDVTITTYHYRVSA